MKLNNSQINPNGAMRARLRFVCRESMRERYNSARTRKNREDVKFFGYAAITNLTCIFGLGSKGRRPTVCSR